MVKVTINMDGKEVQAIKGGFTLGAVCEYRKDGADVGAFVAGDINKDAMVDIISGLACALTLQTMEDETVTKKVCALIDLQLGVEQRIRNYIKDNKFKLSK